MLLISTWKEKSIIFHMEKSALVLSWNPWAPISPPFICMEKSALVLLIKTSKTHTVCVHIRGWRYGFVMNLNLAPLIMKLLLSNAKTVYQHKQRGVALMKCLHLSFKPHIVESFSWICCMNPSSNHPLMKQQTCS